MKRIVTLLLAAGMLMGGSVASAQAADVKISGQWRFAFEWANKSFNKTNSKDTFNAIQRFRTQVDIIASESLKGVVYFEIGKSNYGKADGPNGASLGTDGYTVKVRYSYIDWVVPQTDLKVRVGLQPYALPNFVAGSPLLDADGAGITLAYQFNDMVGASLFWLRAENDNNGDVEFTTDRATKSDAADFFGLTVPVKGDGFKVTPWGMVGMIGNRSLGDKTLGTDGKPANPSDINYLRDGLLPSFGFTANPYLSDDSSSTAWWAGIGGELTMFNPFRVAAEFAYGSVDMGSVAGATLANGTYAADHNITSFDMKRSGWYGALIAEYKLDFMTPGLIFWYASGDDDNPYDGSERMPTMDPSGWNATNFGFDGAGPQGFGSQYDAIGSTMMGTWGIVAQLKNISFLEDLTHTLKLAYYQGTNDENMPFNAGMTNFVGSGNGSYGSGQNTVYMTEKDSAFEVNLVNNYKIYKNLDFGIELDYLRLDMDSGVWEKTMGQNAWDNVEKNAYRVGAYMRYTF